MIETKKDGRTIRTGKDYTLFRHVLWKEQKGCCTECGRFTSLNAELISDFSFHTDHTNGRGMGGSKRDDTSSSCRGMCGYCHRKKHGQ